MGRDIPRDFVVLAGRGEVAVGDLKDEHGKHPSCRLCGALFRACSSRWVEYREPRRVWLHYCSEDDLRGVLIGTSPYENARVFIKERWRVDA